MERVGEAVGRGRLQEVDHGSQSRGLHHGAVGHATLPNFPAIAQAKTQLQQVHSHGRGPLQRKRATKRHRKHVLRILLYNMQNYVRLLALSPLRRALRVAHRPLRPQVALLHCRKGEPLLTDTELAVA